MEEALENSPNTNRKPTHVPKEELRVAPPTPHGLGAAFFPGLNQRIAHKKSSAAGASAHRQSLSLRRNANPAKRRTLDQSFRTRTLSVNAQPKPFVSFWKRAVSAVGLAKAVAHAKQSKAVLVAVKLDRLARNVDFMSRVMESGVDFIAIDMQHANDMTIHLMAAVAEGEAKVISGRIEKRRARISTELPTAIRCHLCLKIIPKGNIISVSHCVKREKINAKRLFWKRKIPIRNNW